MRCSRWRWARLPGSCFVGPKREKRRFRVRWGCAVIVTGAFLYHMIFEAKSQYLFIYLFVMIPAAAWGLSRFFEKGGFRKQARS